ncbi:cytochrome P450 [Aspergillus affinis]|uniref:cytochrome P450 n=1 Tax=Aspergillus affinis TaxID=1070780 RepID=UPI0022FDE483|nr:cytochrome P450 [Aspergillus affinis]KAI9041872.1 cytochrome P450 [Aspergillus affinis]
MSSGQKRSFPPSRRHGDRPSYSSSWARGRLRGSSGTKINLPAPREPSLGALIAQIGKEQLNENYDNANDGAPCITGCRTVASYNWLNRARPTILVPGCPPAWTPLEKPCQLSEDSGAYFRDQNAARYSSHPLQPAMEAVLKQEPTFDMNSVHVVACSRTLGNLLRFVRNPDMKFRILVEVVGSTVFFLRHENSPTEIIPDMRGFGHTFPEAYTTWDRDVRGSESHQRVIKYRFGDVECLVRFEADGYFRDRCSDPDGVPGPQESAIISLLGQATVSSHQPEDTESLQIQDGGHDVPQSAIFDLKTRSCMRKDDDIMAEILPRLWVSQTPNFLLAFHERGRFDDIRIQDLQSAVQAWEKRESKALCRFHSLLVQLISFAHGQPDGRFEIVHEECGDALELREVTPSVNHVIPDGLKSPVQMPSMQFQQYVHSHIKEIISKLDYILHILQAHAQEAIDPLVRSLHELFREPPLTIGASETIPPPSFADSFPSLEFEGYHQFVNAFGRPEFLEDLHLSFLDYIRSLHSAFLGLDEYLQTLPFPFYLLITFLSKALAPLILMVIYPVRLTSLLAGVVTHLVIFRRGEWDRSSPKIAVTFGAIAIVSMLLLFNFQGWSLILFSKLCALYVSGILLSTLFYRLFLHPLHKFPGPLLARITVMWRRPTFKSVWADHSWYGDFVRIGPREVSINNIEGFHQIHGPGSPFVKAPIYECTMERTLHITRENPMLTARTTMWEKSLDQKDCLKGYEAIVRKHCETFIECLKAKSYSKFDITKLLRFFSYDVMSDLALGNSFGMVKSQKMHSSLRQESFIQDFVGSFKCAPWLVTLLKQISVIRDLRAAWFEDCANLVDERLKVRSSYFTPVMHSFAFSIADLGLVTNSQQGQQGQQRADLFSSLLSYAKAMNKSHTSVRHSLLDDADLAISTGTDSIAYTLSALMWLLATHPKQQELLHEEIRRFPPTGSGLHLDYTKDSASYLNACINETVRLYPVIPGGIQRLTPPEGVTIAGRFIPGNTIVSTPIWSMHRDPRYFVAPNEFIPERWTTRKDLVLKGEAFAPFLTGPYGCPAQQFATMEIRMLIGWVVYDFKLRSREENRIGIENIIRNPGPVEKFILQFPAHQLKFTPRDKRSSTDDAVHEEVSKKFPRTPKRADEFKKKLQRENGSHSKERRRFQTAFS